MSSKPPNKSARGKVVPFPKTASCDAAFEEFRVALLRAQKIGSINAMRAAVAAYDKFAAIVGAS